MTFNEYTHQQGVNGDRAKFHTFVRQELNIQGDMVQGDWDWLYWIFCDREDARDLRETQADALR